MKEVYTLKITFPNNMAEVPWSRTIEVKEDCTLEQLHRYIQFLVEFDNDHLYEFYVGRNPRNREYKIPIKKRLNEIYPMTGYKLYYLFDFGDCWLFRIVKSRKTKIEEIGTEYPVLIKSIGENPDQYPEYE